MHRKTRSSVSKNILFYFRHFYPSLFISKLNDKDPHLELTASGHFILRNAFYIRLVYVMQPSNVAATAGNKILYPYPPLEIR